MGLAPCEMGEGQGRKGKENPGEEEDEMRKDEIWNRKPAGQQAPQLLCCGEES